MSQRKSPQPDKRENQREIMLKGGWLTASEAAARIGVNNATIYRMVADGKVETCKSGQLLYLKAVSLAEHYKEAPPIYVRIMAGVENGSAKKK